MPREDFVRTTDDRGRLFIEHDFGAINAGREALVTLDLTPLAHFQGSRLHVLNFVDGPRLGERINILLGNPAVETAADPEAVPIDHENPGETTIENYLATHPEDGWAAAIQQLGEGRWWAPHGGAKPQMDHGQRTLNCLKSGVFFDCYR